MTIAFMGIDLVNNVFQFHGVDAVFKKRVRREGLLAELVKVPACRIGIEACTGAIFWPHQFEALGHTGKVIGPQYVKPFVKHQKNGRNDAEAICIAPMQPNLKFVPPKNEEQQDIQALH